MTMRSKTSEPIESNERTRALPKRSAALGGSGPDAHEGQVRYLGLLHDVGRCARPRKIIAEPNRIVTIELHMQRRIAQIRINQQHLAAQWWRSASRSLIDVSDFPSDGPELVIVNVLGKPFSVANCRAVQRER